VKTIANFITEIRTFTKYNFEKAGAVAAGACRRGGASCLLAAPLEMCSQCGSSISARLTRPIPVVDNAYPYPYGPYPTRAKDFYPILHWDG